MAWGIFMVVKCGVCEKDFTADYRGATVCRSCDSCAMPSTSHPLSERFHAVLKAASELHDKKCKDYGTKTDPFANVRAGTAWGVPAWVSCMIRANDKVKRLQALATNGRLENETARDSFMDFIVYGAIGLVLYDEEQEAAK